MTTPENKSGFRRLLLEGVVVVTSILIAFFLDAAWDNAELARDVRQDLLSVQEELLTNVERAEDHRDLVQQIVTAHDVLLALMQQDVGAGSVSVPDTSAWLQLMTPTFEPSLGALEALVASGRLSAIDDRDLQSQLAGVSAVIEDSSEEEVEAQTFFELVQAPAVFSSLDMSSLSHVADDFAARRPLQSRGLIRYPNSQAIRSAVEYRRFLYLEAITGLGGIATHLRGVADLVDTGGN